MRQQAMTTRMIELCAGQRRREATNAGTAMVAAPSPPPAAPPRAGAFRGHFMAHIDLLRDLCAAQRLPGVVAVAVDERTGRVAGTLALRAPERGDLATAVLGRHGEADLFLDADERLSLRHLLLCLDTGPRYQVTLRLLDLRTALAFEDERGRRLAGLRADGPVLVRAGAYALFFFVTGDGDRWPDRPADAWDALPARVCLDARGAEPDRWARRRPARWVRRASLQPARADAEATLVQALPGPARLQLDLAQPGEEPLGVLEIQTARGRHAVALGAAAARAGVLVGRNERCDAGGLAALDDARLSRVHLVVLQVGEHLYAVDAASTNGTWLGGLAPVRAARLPAALPLVLGDHVAELRWTPRRAPSDAGGVAPGSA
jgi:hypothetical protein